MTAETAEHVDTATLTSETPVSDGVVHGLDAILLSAAPPRVAVTVGTLLASALLTALLLR